MATGSENTFQGFCGSEGVVKAEYVTNEKITALRMEVICSKMEVLSEKVSSLERENKSLWKIAGEYENEKMKIEKLQKRVRALEEENKSLGNVIEEGVKELDGLKDALRKTREEKGSKGVWKEAVSEVQRLQCEQESLKQIIEEQKRENCEIEKRTEELIKKQVDNTAKAMQMTQDRSRNIIIKGVQEPEEVNWEKRRENDMEGLCKVLRSVSEETIWKNQIERCYRLGKFIKGKQRLMKVELKSERTCEDILKKASNLKKQESMKSVYIRRDMTAEERTKEAEVRRKAVEANEGRTEEEKTKFFYVVRRGQVVKRKREGEEKRE